MIRVTTPWLMMQCPTSHKHKKMVKIGRVYMIADRQTHRQTDRHTHCNTRHCPSVAE